MVQEQRHRTFFEHGPGHRAKEEFPESRLSIGSHDQQTGMRLLHLLQDHLGWRHRGGNRVRVRYEVVPAQELYGRLNTEGRLGLMRLDTHDVHLLETGRYDRLERL